MTLQSKNSELTPSKKDILIVGWWLIIRFEWYRWFRMPATSNEGEKLIWVMADFTWIIHLLEILIKPMITMSALLYMLFLKITLHEHESLQFFLIQGVQIYSAHHLR